MTLPGSRQPPGNAETSTQFLASKLEQLGKSYSAELARDRAALVQLFATSISDGWNQVAADELYQRVHKLAGSGGFFGFPGITESARLVLGQLRIEANQAGPSNAAAQQALQKDFSGLLKAMDKVDSRLHEHAAELDPSSASSNAFSVPE